MTDQSKGHAEGLEPEAPPWINTLPSRLGLSRRSFVSTVGTIGLSALGAGVVTGETDDDHGGFGQGGFGEGGFGGVMEPPEISLTDFANEDGLIETSGLRDAVDEWRAGNIETDLLRDVVTYWRSGDFVD